MASSFGEDLNVKVDGVVCELVELGKMLGKVLVREEVPPLATLEDNMDVSVAVLVTPSRASSVRCRQSLEDGREGQEGSTDHWKGGQCMSLSSREREW